MKMLQTMCIWGETDNEKWIDEGYAPVGMFVFVPTEGKGKPDYFTIFLPSEGIGKLSDSRIAWIIGNTIAQELIQVKGHFEVNQFLDQKEK